MSLKGALPKANEERTQLQDEPFLTNTTEESKGPTKATAAEN